MYNFASIITATLDQIHLDFSHFIFFQIRSKNQIFASNTHNVSKPTKKLIEMRICATDAITKALRRKRVGVKNTKTDT